MVTLEEADRMIGQRVVYRPAWMDPDEGEVGVITSVNFRYVFVQYRGGPGSAATSPEDLYWEAEMAPKPPVTVATDLKVGDRMNIDGRDMEVAEVILAGSQVGLLFTDGGMLTVRSSDGFNVEPR